MCAKNRKLVVRKSVSLHSRSTRVSRGVGRQKEGANKRMYNAVEEEGIQKKEDGRKKREIEKNEDVNILVAIS